MIFNTVRGEDRPGNANATTVLSTGEGCVPVMGLLERAFIPIPSDDVFYEVRAGCIQGVSPHFFPSGQVGLYRAFSRHVLPLSLSSVFARAAC